MLKKFSKIQNKYSLYIIIALILILVVWTIVFYFHCNNKEQAIQKALSSAISKEPQREFYTVISGPKYFNKTYGFSMTIPSGKYILEEKFSGSSGDNILLVDESFKDNFRDYFFGSYPGISGKNYFSLYVDAKSGKSAYYLRGNVTELEQMSQRGFVEKTEFLIDGSKKLAFYLTLEKNDNWLNSLDKFLPEATAFFENENNMYYFSSTSYFNDSVEERQSHIDIMEKAIESMKFSN